MVALVEHPRIAVLEADVPMPELEAEFGRYGEMFTRLLTDGAIAASLPTPKVSIWDIINNPEIYPDPSEFDAILVTGHSAYENDAWILKLCEYVKRIYDEYPEKKIIGICFGHQILARALGGKVTVNPRGWEIAVRSVKMADSAKGIFDLHNSIMRLEQMHLDIVSEPPPGATIIGSNDKCECHAMIIPGRALSVQGHPEFNQRIVEFLLETRHFKGILTDDIYKEAYPHAAEPHDGVKVGEGIMNFIMCVKA